MPRAMSSALLAAFKSPGFSPVFFIQAAFNSGTVYIWSGLGPISWNGHTWTGLGNLVSLGAVEDGATVDARPFSFIVSGFDPALLPDVLSEVTLGAPVTIWLGALSPTVPSAELGPHDLTGNTSHAPFVTSASSNFISLTGFHDAWNAFDGLLDWPNEWLGTGGGVDWLQIDIGTAQLLSSYAITVDSTPEPLRAPKNWTMEGSPDGSTWTTLDTQTAQTAWGSGETRLFVCATPGTFRYYRLNITANNGDTSFTQVAELYLYPITAPVVGRVLPDPIILWSGGLDQPTIDIDAKTATINFLCENLLVAMNVAIDRRYSQDDQTMGWPGDIGFSFVNALQQNDILWWGTAPQNINNL